MYNRFTVLIFLFFFFVCTRTQESVSTEYRAYPTTTESWTEENDSRDDERTTTTTNIGRKWISEIFDEVQHDFRMHADVSERCRRDYMMYETYLRNQTIWAIRMMESSEWPRRGLFSGATTALGVWSECLKVRSPTYQGQYCLVDAFYDYTFVEADPVQRGWDKPANENSSVWGVIKMYDKIITRISRHNLTWALCIPSSCTSDELSTSIMNAASPIFRKYGIDFVANVVPNTCRVQESQSLSKTFLYTLSLLLFLSAFVLLATYRDYSTHIALPREQSKKPSQESYSEKVFYSFSLLQSWNCLTNKTPSTIHSLYFAKSILFVLIIIGHEGLLSIPYPKIDQEDTEMVYQPWNLSFGFHSSVDVFLAISGYLTFHFGYEPIKKRGISYFFAAIIFRWIRLIPVMGLFILVYVFVGSELGDGPFWGRQMTYYMDCCRTNWWTNMLAIQNLVNRKDMCLPQTWYIAADFQLTILGTAILAILAKNFMLGIVSMVLTYLTGVGIHFYVIYANKYSGLAAPAIFENVVMTKQAFYSDLYIQIYSRIGPYMVGCGGALIQRALQNKKYHPSKLTIWSIILATGFTGVGSLLYGFLLFVLGRPYDVIENALYGSVTRTLIVLPVISGVILVSLKRMGWFSCVLEWKIFLVLGRLAYVVYLSSFSIQVFRYYSMRQVLNSSFYLETAYGVMTDIVLTMIVSGLLFFLVEGPLHNLTTIAQTISDKKPREYDTRHSNGVEQRRRYDDTYELRRT